MPKTASAKLAALAARNRAAAKSLASCRRLIKASLCAMRLKCGKPSCRCAQGVRHEALAFTYKLKGRSMLLHVPKAMAREARQAAADYAKLKKLVERLSMNNLERFRLKTRKMKRRA